MSWNVAHRDDTTPHTTPDSAASIKDSGLTTTDQFD
jgi:hypothetical protein